MKIKTRISRIQEGNIIIRKGLLLNRLDKSFASTIFLLSSGREPSKSEEMIFNAMLNLTICHGAGTCSSLAARTIQSAGNTLNAAVAGGILAIGDLHGGAIEPAMKQIKQNCSAKMLVKDCLENKKIIYGFGHRIYKQKDPRVKALISFMDSVQFLAKEVDFVLDIEKEMAEQKGKHIPLNIDGLIAAVLLAMGFEPAFGKGFFMIARTPGLVNQAIEQKESNNLIRLSEDEIEYSE